MNSGIIQNSASIFSSKEMDTMPTTIENHHIDARLTWLKMERLLYKLCIYNVDPGKNIDGAYYKLNDALRKQYRTANIYFMYGKAYDGSVF